MIQEKMLEFYPASFMLDGNRIVMTSAYQEPGNKFIVFDRTTLEEKASFFPIEKNELTWRHFMGQSNFFGYKGKILFHEPMNSKIYTICRDTVTVKYSFDFWGHNAPADFWKQKFRNVFDINQEATANNYCYGIPCYAESDNAIIMTYRDGAFYRMLKYDKRKRLSCEFTSMIFPDNPEPVAIGDLCIQFYSNSSMWISVEASNGDVVLYSVAI